MIVVYAGITFDLGATDSARGMSTAAIGVIVAPIYGFLAGVIIVAILSVLLQQLRRHF
jgi:hypothetical protein